MGAYLVKEADGLNITSRYYKGDVNECDITFFISHYLIFPSSSVVALPRKGTGSAPGYVESMVVSS